MSRLHYDSLLCLGAPKLSLSKLQRVRNRALRISLCADRYTTNLKLHQDSNVFPLSLRMKLDTCMYIRLLFLSRIESSNVDMRLNTRSGSSLTIKVNRPSSEKFLHSVTYQGMNMWNELSPRVRDVNDISKFDSEVKNLINAEFMSMISL